MKICYIILTCDKYINNRVKHQMNTFLSNIDKNDIFYLTSNMNIEKRYFGWGCMDDSKNITWKYIHFIYNMNKILHYDWYLFIQDDTFVFINRLNDFLANYNENNNYYIGNQVNNGECLYMSSGSGYVLSKKLYKLLYDYIKTMGINESYLDCRANLCISLLIDKLKKNNIINQIDNKKFIVETEKKTLNDAITVQNVVTKEMMYFYHSIYKNEINILFNQKYDNTVFVTLTDLKYLTKVKRTVIDLRSKGNWRGDIVIITIDFKLNKNFKDFYNIIEVSFPLIDKTKLLSKIGKNGFTNSDKREITKLNQWEKLHVFDNYFIKWDRVIFLDAGLRVLDDVRCLLELDYKNKILAPKDGKYNKYNLFECQLSFDNPQLIEKVKNDFGANIFYEHYFLNCIWIYDTNILKICNKKELLEAMNIYTLSLTNEMAIMNLVLRFKYNLWKSFPLKKSNKYLFDWCELNNPNTSWSDYCLIKYSTSISFDDC